MSAAKEILERTVAIRSATIRTRLRTGLNFAVRVKKGKGQIVEYVPIGDEVREISAWMPLAEIPAALEALK